MGGITYLYIKRNSLLIVATTRFNVSPSIVLEFLNRTCKVIKDYLGVLSEEAIRKNFILVYELLDEILDYGFPQGTSTETLKNFIYNEPVVVDAGRSGRMPTLNNKTTPSMSAHKPITYQRERNGKQKNEIFVDILERLNVLFSPNGYILNSTVDGCIQMKSYLSGNPELKLALNEDLVIGKGDGTVVLDDANFHECCQLQDFENDRTLSFYPPDGEFVVLNYRVTGEFRAPFRVFPTIDEVSPYKLDLTLRLRADIPESFHGANVVVTIPVPRSTASAPTELSQGSAGQIAEFNKAENSVKWHIKKIPGNTEVMLRVKVGLSSAATTSTRKEFGPISLSFEIPMYNVSKLQVRYLRIAEQGKSYNPYRWVRYVTQSSSYVCRV